MLSDREKAIVKIIGSKTKTLEEISSELFKNTKKPFDTNICVANSVRRIIKKCDHYKLDWTLIKNRENNKLLISKEKR